MQDTRDSDNLFEPFHIIARKERGILVRVFCSFAMTCVMVAFALVSSYVIARIEVQPSGTAVRRAFYVRDNDLAIGFAIASVIWLAALWWIWRGQFARNSLAGPAVTSVVIAVGTICLGTVIGTFIRREEEYLIGATVLIGVACICLAWMRYALRRLQGRPILNSDQIVNVCCPNCGYSLVGLNALRCPECGATYTIDALIRAQDYGKAVLAQSDDLRYEGLVETQERKRAEGVGQETAATDGRDGPPPPVLVTPKESA